MKKGLSYLIESELEKAEVVLAAKSITDAIQKMAETAAKWEADDVMPLNDPIREHFGPEAAAAFSEAVAGKLRELVKVLGDTKNAVSDEIARMQGELSGTPQSDLATMDDDGIDGGAPAGDSDLDGMDAPEGDEAAPEGEMSFDAPAAPDAAAAPAPAGDAPKFDDDGNGAPMAAGRARKESAEPMGKMLEAALNHSMGRVSTNESADRRVAVEYVSMLREGHSPASAAAAITDHYGLSIGDLVTIVNSFKK